MFLSQLVLNISSRNVQRDIVDCKAMHRTLMTAFPRADANARQTFGVLYRLEKGTPPVLLAQSKIAPDWEQLPEGYLALEPAVKAVGNQYNRLANGMVLRFRLTANPTKKIDTKTGPDGKRRNGRRVALFREDEQMEWLERRAEAGGFELLNMVTQPELFDVAVGQPHVERSRSGLTFGSVTFDGRLRIIDEKAFRETLVSGIGTGKAYGFGLLSIAL